MSKGKSSSWEIPTREKTGVIGFENPLAQAYWRGTGGQSGYYGWNFSPKGQEYYDTLTAMRNAILGELGYTAPAREASLNKWEDAFIKEALRTSMPQLEQTLFARGMGGSRLYQNAVTDLLSKVATQGVLNREELARLDEQLKLAQLGYLTPEIWNLIGLGESLTGNTAKLTEDQYARMLPYMVAYSGGKSGTMDMLGGGLGALGAVALAPFTGGASLSYIPLAYSLGSTIGGGFNEGGQSQLGSTLNQLASLYSLSQMFGGGIRTPVKSQPYTGLGSSGGYFKQFI